MFSFSVRFLSQFQTPASALILGHSYITRLRKATDTGLFPRDFDLREYHINWWYRGGATISTIRDNLPHVLLSRPQIVVIQIGGNDFDGLVSDSFLDIPFQLLTLARRIRQTSTVKAVYIGKLFYRDIHPKYLPTPTHVQRYNNKVDSINELLEASAPTLAKFQIHVRNCKGRVLLRSAILSCDGTHLNQRGLKKFYRSIRGALVAAKKYLPG